MIGDQGAVAQRQPLGHDRLGIYRPDHGPSSNTSAQIQQTGTLGHRRHAGLDGGSNLGAQRLVGSQLNRVHFGKSAAQIKPSRSRRERRVGRRVEDHRFAAGSSEQLVGLGVAKGKGAASGNGDDRT